MRHLFDIPLGASYAPIGFKREGIDYGAIAAIGGSALIGALVSNINTNNTNNTNYENVRETNTQNALMHQADLAWSKQQYEDQKLENRYLVDLAYQRQNDLVADERAYTDPAAVKQRYLEAGINPYLASQAGIASGSSGSQSVQSGSAPSYNTPSSPEMKAAQAISNNSFGLGINQAINNYLALKQNEREDYRLASDITFADAKQRIDYLDYRLKRSSSETESAYLKKQMEALDKEMALNRDKFEQGVAWQNFQKEVQNYQLRLSEKELAIKQFLANNEVSLGAATIEKLASECNYLDKQAYEMVQNGVSKREIDGWISEQERMINNIIHDDELQKKFNNGKGLGVYTRFSRWLLDPIKGVLSGNASVKPK